MRQCSRGSGLAHNRSDVISTQLQQDKRNNDNIMKSIALAQLSHGSLCQRFASGSEIGQIPVAM